MKKIIISLLLYLFLLAYKIEQCLSKNIIPILYGIDHKISLFTLVSITSLCINGKEENFYKIFIMIQPDFPENEKEKILSVNYLYLTLIIIYFVFLSMSLNKNPLK